MTQDKPLLAPPYRAPMRRVHLAAAAALLLPALVLPAFVLMGGEARAQAAGPARDPANVALESDTWLPPHRARVDLDRPLPATDCNRNAVEDRLDLAGVIARGPVSVGSRPGRLAAADLNGDRRSDLIVSHEGGTSVGVLWHRYARRFEAGPVLEVGQMPSCIAVGDLDGDGHPDLVVGHSGLVSSATVLWNDGAGGFRRDELSMVVDAGTLPSPRCVAVADVDGDGRPDIVATSGAGVTDRMLTLFRNRGARAFDAPVRRALDATTPDGLVVADFDGDGRPDLAVAGGNAGRSVSVVFNGGAGLGFDRWPAIRFEDVGCGPVAILAADFNGDGHLDLATANYESADVSVLLNDPTHGRMSRFAPAVRYAVGRAPRSLGVADLDGDGRPDIVVPVNADSRVAVLRNAGAGRFDSATYLPVGREANGIWAGNLDSDGHAEVAVSHSPDDTVWVLHMKAQPAAPDCNANRIPDACDIASGHSADANRDGRPDECGPAPAPARRRMR